MCHVRLMHLNCLSSSFASWDKTESSEADKIYNWLSSEELSYYHKMIWSYVYYTLTNAELRKLTGH
jgi:hypothetical protein